MLIYVCIISVCFCATTAESSGLRNLQRALHKNLLPVLRLHVADQDCQSLALTKASGPTCSTEWFLLSWPNLGTCQRLYAREWYGPANVLRLLFVAEWRIGWRKASLEIGGPIKRQLSRWTMTLVCTRGMEVTREKGGKIAGCSLKTPRSNGPRWYFCSPTKGSRAPLKNGCFQGWRRKYTRCA